MKKIFCIVLCAALLFSAGACGAGAGAPWQSGADSGGSQRESLYSGDLQSGDPQSGKPRLYTVTFVLDGGKIEREYESELSSTDFALPEGFVGWAVDPEEKYKLISLPYSLTEDITLYAVAGKDFENCLPVVNIRTKNVPITSKEDYVEARISLSNVKEEYEIFSAAAGIRLRGNSTKNYPKKPYRIKFEEKQSVFGEAKHKSWVLLADYLDASLMKNYSALYFARQLDGLGFTSCAYHVELYLNGAYQGVYLFCDQIQEQKASRVPIETDELGETEIPFLIEKNYRAESESEGEYDWFGLGENQYTVKYPENLTLSQYNYIVDYYTRLETAVRNKDLEYVRANVDLNSLYDFYIVNEMFFNRDAIWTSCYMYKTADGKLKFGPVWDFDWSLDTPWTNAPTVSTDVSSAGTPFFTEYDDSENGEGWWCWLMPLLEDEECRAEFSARWRLARPAILNTIGQLGSYKRALLPAAKRNAELWYRDYEVGGSAGYTPQNGSLFEDQYKFLTDFLTLRMEFFDRNFS